MSSKHVYDPYNNEEEEDGGRHLIGTMSGPG